MVTNPATRDWTVTASVFATLNEMYGNRTCAASAAATRRCGSRTASPRRSRRGRSRPRDPRARQRPEVDYKGSTITLPWATSSRSRSGAPATDRRRSKTIGETCDGFILQLADPDIAEWTITAVRAAPRRPVATPTRHDLRGGTGVRRRRRRPHARSVPWFGGMVGNHVADIVTRYGEPSDVPQALTDYIKGREGYDYNQHGLAGNIHADSCPTRSSTGSASSARSSAHRAGSRSCARSASTSSRSTSSTTARTTLQAYGERIIPATDAAPKCDRGPGNPGVRPRRSAGRCCSSRAVLVACVWEGYKAIGPEGRQVPRHAARRDLDRAMPHIVGHGQRLGEPEDRGGESDRLSVPATLVLVPARPLRSRARRGRRIGTRGGDGALPVRGPRPSAVDRHVARPCR